MAPQLRCAHPSMFWDQSSWGQLFGWGFQFLWGLGSGALQPRIYHQPCFMLPLTWAALFVELRVSVLPELGLDWSFPSLRSESKMYGFATRPRGLNVVPFWVFPSFCFGISPKRTAVKPLGRSGPKVASLLL